MRQRGKQSAAALAVATPIARERLAAPVHLSDAEIAVWSALVNDQPAEAFSATHLPLLEAYCRHVVRGRVLAAEIDNFDPEWMRSDEGLERYDRLLKMAEREARAANALARSLRITRQSTVDPKTAGRAVAGVARARRPWDVPEDASA